MIHKCATCGKEFDALWPDLYRYKRGGTFLCSWSCLRKYDEEKGSGNMTLTDKQKRIACEMALEGKNPMPYLKEIGAKNPTVAWDTCLNWAKKNNMEGFDMMPKRFGQQKKEAPKVELVYDPGIAEEYRREQEEKKANEEARKGELDAAEYIKHAVIGVAPAPEPVTEIWTLGAEGYAATAIKKDGIGEFYYDRKHGTIDWENEYGEEISLLPADWMRLAEEIPKVMKILGADAWT